MNAVALGLLLALPGTPTPPTCFPRGAVVDEFRAEWYCGQLAAAGLGALTSDPGYRFTYLPSFHSARVVWVALEAGSPVVRGIVLTRPGASRPEKIERQTRRIITFDEWRLLQQRLENAGLWESTDTNKESGVDGAIWLLEGRRDSVYRLHDVWSPVSEGFPQYVKACRYMLDLAGIRPPEEELY